MTMLLCWGTNEVRLIHCYPPPFDWVLSPCCSSKQKNLSFTNPRHQNQRNPEANEKDLISNLRWQSEIKIEFTPTRHPNPETTKNDSTKRDLLQGTRQVSHIEGCMRGISRDWVHEQKPFIPLSSSLLKEEERKKNVYSSPKERAQEAQRALSFPFYPFKRPNQSVDERTLLKILWRRFDYGLVHFSSPKKDVKSFYLPTRVSKESRPTFSAGLN